jgi:hypothetical protein
MTSTGTYENEDSPHGSEAAAHWAANWQSSGGTPPATQRLIACRSTDLYLYNGIVGETVIDVSARLLAQHDGLPGLFHIALSEQSNVRELGDEGRLRRRWTLAISALLAQHAR